MQGAGGGPPPGPELNPQSQAPTLPIQRNLPLEEAVKSTEESFGMKMVVGVNMRVPMPPPCFLKPDRYRGAVQKILKRRPLCIPPPSTILFFSIRNLCFQ